MSATGTNTSTQAHLLLVNSASSISDCFKSRNACSRRCHSSSMSWTLVSYTRCWMTDHFWSSVTFLWFTVYICGMSDNRKTKLLVFGVMNGYNNVARPHREWVDDIVEFCRSMQSWATLRSLHKIEQLKWNQIIKEYYGRWAKVYDDNDDDDNRLSTSSAVHLHWSIDDLWSD